MTLHSSNSLHSRKLGHLGETVMSASDTKAVVSQAHGSLLFKLCGNYMTLYVLPIFERDRKSNVSLTRSDVPMSSLPLAHECQPQPKCKMRVGLMEEKTRTIQQSFVYMQAWRKKLGHLFETVMSASDTTAIVFEAHETLLSKCYVSCMIQTR